MLVSTERKHHFTASPNSPKMISTFLLIASVYLIAAFSRFVDTKLNTIVIPVEPQAIETTETDLELVSWSIFPEIVKEPVFLAEMEEIETPTKRTLKDLKNIASKMDIKGRSKMNREQLQQAIGIN